MGQTPKACANKIKKNELPQTRIHSFQHQRSWEKHPKYVNQSQDQTWVPIIPKKRIIIIISSKRSDANLSKQTPELNGTLSVYNIQIQWSKYEEY